MKNKSTRKEETISNTYNYIIQNFKNEPIATSDFGLLKDNEKCCVLPLLIFIRTYFRAKLKLMLKLHTIQIPESPPVGTFTYRGLLYKIAQNVIHRYKYMSVHAYTYTLIHISTYVRQAISAYS